MATVYVIPGHGGADPGACGNGYGEAERVRALATRMKELGGDAVQLWDFSRDCYTVNGIAYLSIPADWQILELHMDSAAPSARGGHCEIKAGFSPDAYDSALGAFITGMFPGRADAGGIRYRSDLQNMNVAANRGYSYRLLECCFISNADDVNTFNTRMDDLARGLLGCFGISTAAPAPVETEEERAARIERERVEGLPDALKGYRDLWPDRWYISAVNDAVTAGLMRGTAADWFGAEEGCTRAMAVAVMANKMGADLPELPFEDIAPWYTEAFMWAAEAGIVDNTAENARPEDVCTRAEFVTMLWRANGKPEATGTLDAQDADTVPEWAIEPITWAYKEGIIGSGGVIDANGQCSRAMAAAMATR